MTQEQLGSVLQRLDVHRTQLNAFARPSGSFNFIAFAYSPELERDQTTRSNQPVEIAPDDLNDAYDRLQEIRGRLSAIELV